MKMRDELLQAAEAELEETLAPTKINADVLSAKALRAIACILLAQERRKDEENEWRLFATAPKDRTEILVYRPDAGVFTALYCPARTEDGEEDENNWGWFTVQGEDIDNDPPTHWMPLPHGPKGVTTNDQ